MEQLEFGFMASYNAQRIIDESIQQLEEGRISKFGDAMKYEREFQAQFGPSLNIVSGYY